MSHFVGQNMSAEALIKSPWWLLLGHPWLAHTWYRKTSSQTQNLPMQWWKVVGLYCRLRKPREEGGIWEMAKNGQNGQKWLEYLPKDLYRLRMATFGGGISNWFHIVVQNWNCFNLQPLFFRFYWYIDIISMISPTITISSQIHDLCGVWSSSDWHLHNIDFSSQCNKDFCASSSWLIMAPMWGLNFSVIRPSK